MNQKPDHPHHAAVHLMKALKCCKQCSESQQVDLIEIRELEYRKNLLAQQLRQIAIRGESVEMLQNEIRELDELIVRLQDENKMMQNEGLKRIEMAVQQRKSFQNEQMATIITQLQLQIQTNRQLKYEMQMMMEKIKYLNRVNDEIVYNFVNL